MAKRKKNPSALATGLGLAAAAGVGYLVYNEVKDKPKKKGSTTSPLSGVYTPGSTFGNSPETVAKVMVPIELSFEPQARNPQTGEITPLGTKTISVPAQLGVLVTNLTPIKTVEAFGYSDDLIGTDGLNVQDAAVRDAVVQKTLQKVAPGVNWSKGLSPYTFGSSEYNVWQGVQLLAEIAHQSRMNKAAVGA